MGTEGWPLIAQCSDDGLKCTKDAEHLDDASAFDDRHINFDWNGEKLDDASAFDNRHIDYDCNGDNEGRSPSQGKCDQHEEEECRPNLPQGWG